MGYAHAQALRAIATLCCATESVDQLEKVSKGEKNISKSFEF